MRKGAVPPLALVDLIAGLEAILVEIAATLRDGPPDAYPGHVVEKVRELTRVVAKWKKQPPTLPLTADALAHLFELNEKVQTLRSDAHRRAEECRAAVRHSSN